MADVKCPECGGDFVIDTHAETESPIAPGYLVAGRDRMAVRRKTVMVAFCMGCEFAHEFKAVA